MLDVFPAFRDCFPIAASQTDAVLGATGAKGDTLIALVVTVTTTATSTVSIKDGSGSSIPLVPANTPVGAFVLRLGIISTNGAWKVTTGAGVTVVGIGRFT